MIDINEIKDFVVNSGLYKPLKLIEADHVSVHTFATNKGIYLDMYCADCNEMSTFNVYKPNDPYMTVTDVESYIRQTKYFNIRFQCVRDIAHEAYFSLSP